MTAFNTDPGFLLRNSKKVLEILIPFCKGGILDWKGHFKHGETFSNPGSSNSSQARLERVLRNTLFFNFDEEFFQVVGSQQFREELLPIPGTSRELHCYFCGQGLNLGVNKRGLFVLGEPCPFSDGLVTEYELNVPSGKIVVDNDLRGWFPVDTDHNLDTLFGCHNTSLDYAAVGLAHGFVGNTSPDVYKDGTRFVIGTYDEEIWDEESGDCPLNPEPCPWGERVAGICTDLWWFSIADYEEFDRRRQHYMPERSMDSLEEFYIVDVKPGVYRFRQEQGINRDTSIVEYASFQWVREPDPVKDFIKEDLEKQQNATEVLIQNCLSWSSLYMGGEHGDWDQALTLWGAKTFEEKVKALAKAANQVMVTIGSGVEWHENGFPRGKVSKEAKELAAKFGEVPFFDFKTDWYPISEGYGGLCLGAGVRSPYTQDAPLVPLNPSFVRLGLNICQNVLKYGEKPSLDKDVYPPTYEIPFVRDRMHIYAECYQGLRKRYPDVVFDEEFDRWMVETDLDKYIEEVDLGPQHPPKDQWGTPPVTIKTGEYFEFDASKLAKGHFCWAKGSWAAKENAERYALGVLCGTQSEMGHLHVDQSARLPSMIPLKAVGRVLRGTGEGHQSKHLVVTFDYGTENMRGEMAFGHEDMEAVEQFDDPEKYARLLKKYRDSF